MNNPPKITPQGAEPPVNTWWARNCNRKRYYLREIHTFFGGERFVWIYEEGVNRCLHLPLKSLLKNYTRILTGPTDPATGNVLPNTN